MEDFEDEEEEDEVGVDDDDEEVRNHLHVKPIIVTWINLDLN